MLRSLDEVSEYHRSRERRGRELVDRVHDKGDMHYIVHSARSDKVYHIDWSHYPYTCDCPDYERGNRYYSYNDSIAVLCKHLWAVWYYRREHP